MLSVNRAACKLVEKLCDNADKHKITVTKQKTGATIIDAGIKAEGSFSAGRAITEICMGGLATAQILPKQYGDFELPSIFVQTNHPAIATLGSQFAGWHLRKPPFSAIVSGPGRALALKPKEIYDKIGYKDKADSAVVVLETNKNPPEPLLSELASECGIKQNKLYVILTPTTSITGSVQISGRVTETAIHKLTKLGLDPKTIDYICGYAPVAPVHPEFAEAMERTNDAILYGGIVYCTLHHKNDKHLKSIVDKAPSKASKQYGKPFKQILKQANNDIFKMDPLLFAPAMLIVNNLKTGTTYSAGEINVSMLKRTLGLAQQ